MTDTLAKQFDAVLEQTAIDISGIVGTKAKLATVFAAMLKAEYPSASDLSIVTAATNGVERFVAEMQEKAAEKGIDAARFGRALADSDSLQTSIVNHCHDRFKQVAVSIRAERRATEEGIIRDNSAFKEGIEIGGKVYPAHV